MSALVFTCRHPARAPLLLLLELATIHTGFGFLAGFLFIALPALEVWKTSRSGDLARRRLVLLFLFCSLGVAGVFLIDYHPHTAAGCFSFPDPHWGFYLSFVALMMGAFGGFLLGTAPIAYALLSTAVGAGALWVIFRASRRLLAARSIDEDPRTLVVASLGLFSLVFAASVAVGRICFSPAYGQSSRYMTLLIPAVLAIDLEVAAMINVRWRFMAGVLLAAIVLHGYISPTVPPSHPAAMIAEQKKQWRACYRSTLDRGRCDRLTGLDVYGGASDTLERELRYIRVHRLNIFAP